MNVTFVLAVAFAAAIIVIVLALVIVIVYQRWRISDNNAHLEKFINENQQLKQKMQRAGIV